jgi:hypothetical protein
MARPRQYASEAERAAAYRRRLAEQTVRVDRAALARLHARLEQLQRAIAAAAQAGDPTALAVRAAAHETLLERLAGHFEARARPAAAREGGPPPGADPGGRRPGGGQRD